MSLNWDVTAVTDHEAILEDTEWPVTEALLFATMSVGMGEITAENVDEFAIRSQAYQQVNGAWLSRVGDDGKLQRVPVTYADIKRRIGLKTNASRLTRVRFKNDLSRNLFEEAERTVKRERERVEASERAASEAA